MESEISVLQVEKRIRTRVKRQMEKTQREYYLNEQMKAIQKELGDEEGRDELQELEDKIKKTKLSKEAREKATHELKKLRQMSPMSAEATVVRDYLTGCCRSRGARRARSRRTSIWPSRFSMRTTMAWRRSRTHRRVSRRAAARQQAHGPILCRVGPPGVGKTSLGK